MSGMFDLVFVLVREQLSFEANHLLSATCTAEFSRGLLLPLERR